MLDLRCSRRAINAKRDCTVLSTADITGCLRARRQGGIRSRQPIFRVPRTLGIRLLRFRDGSLSIMQADACRLNI